MKRTHSPLLCTLFVCMAALLPTLALGDQRPADKPFAVFLPMTMRGNGTSPAGYPPPVTNNPPTATPTPPPAATPAPTSPPAATPPPATGADLTPMEAEVVRLTNEFRAKNGCLVPLKPSAELTKAARAHSKDMAINNFFDHKGSDGSQPWDRMTAAGYKWRMAAENIEGGASSAQEVFDAWKSSSGHRANMLNCEYKDIGIGYVSDPNDTVRYYHYWTQDFGTRQ